MNVQRRQSPTCGLPYPGERDPELSSWGLLTRSRAVQANLSLGAQPGTWNSSAGLWGEQTPEATAGSKAEGLGCVALRYEEEAHRSAQRVHVPVVLEGLGAGHGSTLLEHRAARGQVVLEPVGRSQTRLSYC